MADNFSSLPPDDGASLTRADLVTFGRQTAQNAQNGSKSAPGIAFETDQTSGLYLYPDGSAFGFVKSGVEVMTITQKSVAFQVASTGITQGKEIATNLTNPGASYALSFSAQGNVAFNITPNAPLTLTMNTQSAQIGLRQVIHVTVIQSATQPFPVSISMGGVRFPKTQSGAQALPTISANPGDDTPLTFISLGDPAGTITGFAGNGG